MTFTNKYEGGDNHITVKEWEGKKPSSEPDFIYSDGSEYYYQIEMSLDDNGAFEELAVKKVGGGDADDARGGEWYEKMDEEDIEMILDYVSDCLE